jgi:propanol-preferring alcohol dehydrogenase
MRAMVMLAANQALQLMEVPVPRPKPDEILIRVDACAVCRTDLHVVDGDLRAPKLPLIPGHEIVGRVIGHGANVTAPAIGERVGVPWLGWTCGACDYCRTGHENLCPNAQFTGYTRDGGFAQYCVADVRYCFRLPERYDDISAAPLMCAGLIGYRSYRKIGVAERIGVYGFGAAAHLITQVAVAEKRRVYAFTKPGDTAGQAFAQSLGCVWTGGSDVQPPDLLDAAIIFAPVGALVPAALKALRPGGHLVCAGIHMTDIPAFPYDLLWSERMIESVANLTRADGDAFMDVVSRVPLKASTRSYPLAQANAALDDLRAGRIEGAAVLIP